MCEINNFEIIMLIAFGIPLVVAVWALVAIMVFTLYDEFKDMRKRHRIEKGGSLT